MIGMGLSLAMKDNRDGNLETQSQDQDAILLNANLSKRAELVSDAGSLNRPSSVQMINRPDDPVLTEPTSVDKQLPPSEQAPKFIRIFNQWRDILLVAGILLLLFSLCLVLYCMVNFTQAGLKLFLTTMCFSVLFDSVMQLVVIVGISARQVKCEVK